MLLLNTYLACLPLPLQFEGDLQPERLSRALQFCINRHKMLRCVITEDGLNQILRSVPAYNIPVHDISHLSPSEQQQYLADKRAATNKRVFDASKWPLFDIQCVRLGPGVVRLQTDWDHLCIDLRSVFMLLQEWSTVYSGKGHSLPPVTRFTYRQAVAAIKESRKGRAYTAAKQYWWGRLEADSLPMAPSLPLRRALETVQQPTFRRLHRSVPADAWKAIKKHARHFGVTPTVLMLTAFSNILAAWSNTQHFVINISVFNLMNREAARVLGDFTTTILAEADLRECTTFQQMVRRMQTRFATDMQHSAVSGLEVTRERVRRMAVDGASMAETGAAICPIVFTSELGVNAGSILEGLGEPVEGLSATPQVILDSSITNDGDEAVITWDYVEEVFPNDMIHDMMEAFVATTLALQRAAAWTETFQLPLPASHLAMVQSLNSQPRMLDAAAMPGTLVDLVEAQVRMTPDAPAVLCPDATDGCSTLTYLHLWGRAVQLGAALVALLTEQGGTRDRLVAVVMTKGWQQVVGAVGTQWAGAAYLPLNHQDPLSRMTDILDAGRCDVVLTTDAVLADFESRGLGGVGAFGDRTVVSITAADGIRLAGTSRQHTGALAAAAAAVPLDTTTALLSRPRPAVAPTDLAYVIFTSGSTGKPKGVMVQHNSAVNTVVDIHFRVGMGPTDRIIALHKFSFDLSVWDVFGTLTAGAALVMPRDDRARDMQYVAELCANMGVTCWNSVPTWVAMFVEYAAGRPVLQRTCLRVVMMSGDKIPAALPDQIKAALAAQTDPDTGAARPAVAVMGLGGPTEDTIWCMAFHIDERDPEWNNVPYGVPMQGMRVYVLDDAMRQLPMGATGEIYFAGVGVARGYWGNLELTKERFPTYPATGERLHRTGDVGRISAKGYIEIMGRCDAQVKVSGYRVELGELEAKLLEHPQTQRATALLVDRKLMAFVVPASHSAAAAAAATMTTTAAATAATPSATTPRASSKRSRPVVRTAADKAVFKMRQHNLRADLADCSLKLELPITPLLQEAIAADWSLWQRHSCRDFAATPVPMAMLMPPLYAAAAALAHHDKLGDVAVYVKANNLANHTAGVYMLRRSYDQSGWELEWHSPAGEHSKPVHVPANVEWAETAPTTVFFVAGHSGDSGFVPPGAAAPRRNAEGDDAAAAAIEQRLFAVGSAVQAFSDMALHSGLGACAAAGADSEQASKALFLMPGRTVMLTMVAGVPSQTTVLPMSLPKGRSATEATPVARPQPQQQPATPSPSTASKGRSSGRGNWVGVCFAVCNT